MTVDLHDPAPGEDLQLFLSLMLTITQAKERQSEQQGIEALAPNVLLHTLASLADG